MVYCNKCFICGGLTEVRKGESTESTLYVCSKCKDAIVFVKTHKEDLLDVILDHGIKKSLR